MVVSRIILSFAVLAVLSGCASGAKIENLAYTGVGASQKKYDKALVNEVALASVKGGEETNPLWTSEISNAAFSSAVKESLATQGLFSKVGRYALSVELKEVDQPSLGFDMTVTTHVAYMLTDLKNNTVVMKELIVTPFTATVSDALLGFERLRVANEGSGKKNISKLLEKLAALKISARDISLVK